MLHRRTIHFRGKTFHGTRSWPIVRYRLRRFLGSVYFWHSSPNFLTNWVHWATLPRRKTRRLRRSPWRLQKSSNFDCSIFNKFIHNSRFQCYRCYDYKIRFCCSEINCGHQPNSRNLDRFYFHGYWALPRGWTRWIRAFGCWNFSLQRDYRTSIRFHEPQHQSQHRCQRTSCQRSSHEKSWPRRRKHHNWRNRGFKEKQNGMKINKYPKT